MAGEAETGALEELVLLALERIDAGGWGELDALCAEHPDRADRLRRRVRKLLDVGLIAPPWEAPKPVPDQLGDFRLIEKIGGGGMGLVYRAEQVSLSREVALKLVRPEQLWFGAARERFLREVEIVAGLSHPGIVPVFAVGEEEGVPFFAMERVHGVSLGDVVDELRAGGTAPAALTGADFVRALERLVPDAEPAASDFFQGVWPDVCLRIVREVAEALEHAHRRGVLHRDVKPSNVMITPEGRVMLLDFGLSSTGETDRLTRTGTAVGSVPYMSPEQVAADRALDVRTDVYSLGVTLYELLSLTLPFEGDSAIQLAERIQSGAAAPLPEHNPNVSWEVATVVATAMEVDPDRRYASAADFARDLGHALARRPIEARPPGPWLRARRWVQRHPTAAVAVVAAFLLLVLAPSVFAWREWKTGRVIAGQRDELERTNEALSATNEELGRVNAELGRSNEALSAANEALEDSLAATEAERARAERNFQRAYEAVETMLERVGWEVLADMPGMEDVRRELLNDALAYHEQFLAEGERDPEQQALYLRTLQRVGEIRSWLNEFEGAAAALSEREELLTALVRADPEPGNLLELARTHYRLAEVLSLDLRCDEAVAEARAAIELLESPPLASSARLGLLGSVRVELGNALQRGGRYDEGRAVLEDAVLELREYVDEHPGSVDELGVLADALLTLGQGRPMIIVTNEQDDGEMRRAEGWLVEAVELLERLLELDPSPGLRRKLADARNVLGTVYMSQARTAEARRVFEAARDAFARLRSTFPGVPYFAEGLATTSMNLVTLMRHYEESGDWGANAAVALEAFEELAAAHPGHRQFESMHYYALRMAADARLALAGDPEGAVRLGERALTEGERLVEAYGDPTVARSQLSTRYMLSRALAALGRHARAAERAREVEAAGEFRAADDWMLHAEHLIPCVVAASADPELGTDGRRRAVAEYAREVVAALREARARGFDDERLRAVLATPSWSDALTVDAFAAELREAGFAVQEDVLGG